MPCHRLVPLILCHLQRDHHSVNMLKVCHNHPNPFWSSAYSKDSSLRPSTSRLTYGLLKNSPTVIYQYHEDIVDQTESLSISFAVNSHVSQSQDNTHFTAAVYIPSLIGKPVVRDATDALNWWKPIKNR